MKIRLVYKFFLAFFLTSLIIIMLMTGIIRHFAKKNFEDFVGRMEATRLNATAETLTDSFREHKSWGFLRSSPQAFSRLTKLNFPDPGAHQGPGPHGDLQGRPPMPMNNPPPDMHGEPPSPLPGPPPHMRMRLALFDEHRNPVAGGAQSVKGFKLKELTVDGRTVGWLGIEKRNDIHDPVQEAFLEQQAQVFLLTALASLLLSAVASYLFSLHLLRPVEALTRGANALASRRFDTRIDVATGDELEQLARDFNHMAQELERNEVMRHRWISDISHELRTPLAILRGEVEAIQDGVREANEDTLQSVHTEIMLLSSLVNDLHELSIADSGTLSMKMRPLNVHETLQEALNVFAQRFSGSGIDIEQDREPWVAPMVSADRERLLQVFSNILENTLRYTESPGKLQIGHEIRGDSIMISFEDSKPGVPGDTLERLFDRLYRVDGSRNRKHGGSGLGLAICRSIVEGFSGEIHAYHSSLGGVKIEITLPLIRSAGRGGHHV